MKWTHQRMYIARDSQGVIVRMQEDKPDGYMSIAEKRARNAHRQPSGDVEKSIRDYARKKKKEKQKRMGN